MSLLSKTAKVDVRLARDSDDLTGILRDPSQVNRDQLFVAVYEDKIVGMVAMWDGGHSVIVLDDLMVLPGYPSAGPKLILAVNEWCQAHGKTAMLYSTGNVALVYHAQRRGAKIRGPLYRVHYTVTDKKGAVHA